LNGSPSTVALLSVGGVERSHLRLLLRRAVSAFPEARIIVCDWIATSEKEEAEEEARHDPVVRCANVAALEQSLRFATLSEAGTTLAVAG
jgi:hypothetical protein